MGIDDHDTFTGLTPLQGAAHEGNIAKVIELLDAGADLNIQANGEVRAAAAHIPSTPSKASLFCLHGHARTHVRVYLRTPTSRFNLTRDASSD